MAGIKRSAEDETPSLSKQDASRRFAVPMPKKPKTVYTRFKLILQKAMKAQGKTASTENVKDAWNIVKNRHYSDDFLEENQNHANATAIQAKLQAEKEERDETKDYQKSKKQWCESFNEAAKAHLTWLTMEATNNDIALLEKAISKVESIKDWVASVPRDYLDALAKAKEEVKSLKRSGQQKELVTKLRNASDEELNQHAQEYLIMLENAKELEGLQKEKQAMKEENHSVAMGLESEIAKNLSKQMVYTGSRLKNSGKAISYRRSGVTPATFAEAFDVKEGTKKATLDGDICGYKSLRYGAVLECSTISVKLNGSDLVASAKYFMSR